MPTISQKEAILEDLMQGRRPSQLDAYRDYGCTRLAARINDLRNEGYDIVTEQEHDPDTGKMWARYRMRNESKRMERV